MEKGKVRIGSIVIDAKDFARMMAFWQEALGYAPRRHRPPATHFRLLS